MASSKALLALVMAMAEVPTTSSITSPAAILLGIQNSASVDKGPLPILAHMLNSQEPTVDATIPGEERCGPPIGWSTAFFGCGFLSGIIVTVLAVGALSDRNPAASKKALYGATEKDSRLVARDPEPEPGAGNSASNSLTEDGWLQGQPSQPEEICDNIQDFWPRCTCLAVLLFIQSGSSIILQSFQQLVSEHTSLVFFFTMLVGLGGNAGVQSVVLAVRRFAKHEEVSVSEQFFMGCKLAAVLAPLAFLRCWLQGTTFDVCLTVGVASVVITVLATSLGTSLALLLQRFRMDPAHASPTIQVIMDMAGLLIACTFGWFIMDVMSIS